MRPIVLYKATDINGDAPPEKLKHHLMDVHKVPEGEIAIQTGEIRELDGVDVAASNFNHIITVEALREGWDCPFAYVFCSADNIQSQTPVEQFLGRVMRMPFAKKRPAEELNKRLRAHALRICQRGVGGGSAKNCQRTWDLTSAKPRRWWWRNKAH